MNILEEIVVAKKVQVEELKRRTTRTHLLQMKDFQVPPRSLMANLLIPGATGIIAEFKRKSPSKGVLNSISDIRTVAKAYAAQGASGMSVLTDFNYFGGSNEDLQLASLSGGIPVLRKEFIIDEIQVLESRAIGANAILLIAECLTAEQVKQLSSLAREIGLETLLEVHSARELDKICDSIDMVGVNNRDLTSFRVELDRSFELAGKIPSDKVKVAESGISDPSTVRSLREAGFRGFLIGEIFMKQSDPGKAFGEFVLALKELDKHIG